MQHQHHSVFVAKAVAQASALTAPQMMAVARSLERAAAEWVDIGLRLAAVGLALHQIGIALVAAHRGGKFYQPK